MQQGGDVNSKILGIIAMKPYSNNFSKTCTKIVEVEGGIGVVNTDSLLQKGATREGNLPHVFHEGVQSDLNPDHRAPTNNKTQQQQSKQQQGQHQGQTVAIK